jgi:catechol 2,3-dioxygenase-like lactoylglutathione lyase family enzyme
MTMAAKTTTATKKKAKAKASRKPAGPARKGPETLRMRTATPSFTVDDIDQSLRWYRDVLGFVVGERWEEGGQLLGVEMVAGGVSFFLTQDDWKKGRDRAKGEGFRIYCTTAQDVDGLAKLVKARGGTLDREPSDEMGTRNFAVVDPDGYKITIGAVGKK